MGQTARERFHELLGKSEVSTQGQSAEAQPKQAAKLSAEDIRRQLTVIADGMKVMRRREELLKRINALGVTMSLSEVPADPDEVDKLEATVAELERGE
jgi:hypothetical protein